MSRQIDSSTWWAYCNYHICKACKNKEPWAEEEEQESKYPSVWGLTLLVSGTSFDLWSELFLGSLHKY